MRYKPFGKTGMKVSEMTLGTWGIGGAGWDDYSEESRLDAIRAAVECGVNLIDTAPAYNAGVAEQYVGKVLQELGVRQKMFIATKCGTEFINGGYVRDCSRETIIRQCETSLRNLRTDYLDLYLIHWPAVARWHDDWREINRSTWRAFEELYREGRIKAIGVSNFLAHHVQALTEDGDIKPMVNQIEYHPGFGQVKSAEYCQANGIVVEAWSPLGSGGVLKNGELNRIAKKYNKSAAQICIRWLLQKNIVPLPKSTHEKYIMENADVFDFALSKEDMASIDRIPYCGGMMFDPDSARS